MEYAFYTLISCNYSPKVIFLSVLQKARISQCNMHSRTGKTFKMSSFMQDQLSHITHYDPGSGLDYSVVHIFLMKSYNT